MRRLFFKQCSDQHKKDTIQRGFQLIKILLYYECGVTAELSEFFFSYSETTSNKLRGVSLYSREKNYITCSQIRNDFKCIQVQRKYKKIKNFGEGGLIHTMFNFSSNLKYLMKACTKKQYYIYKINLNKSQFWSGPNRPHPPLAEISQNGV